MLVKSGKPELDTSDKSHSSGLLDEDEDDSFGIVPTKNLQKQVAEEQQVSDFGNFDDPTLPVEVPEAKQAELVMPETNN